MTSGSPADNGSLGRVEGGLGTPVGTCSLANVTLNVKTNVPCAPGVGEAQREQ